METRDATLLLQRLNQGDGSASAELFGVVHAELRRLAERYMRDQRADHTLQATALVNEAWLKLVDVDQAGVADRAHFFRLAATAMRSVLIDHARARRRQKRGGDRLRVTVDAAGIAADDAIGAPDLLDLDESLKRLTAMDEQLSRLVELRFFGGLTNEQTADILGVSSRTVERSWRVAQAWLRDNLEKERR